MDMLLKHGEEKTEKKKHGSTNAAHRRTSCL
jgi:hypothetical protein